MESRAATRIIRSCVKLDNVPLANPPPILAQMASAVTIEFEGVRVHTLGLEGMLRTKQTLRDKDKLDRMVLERALQELKKG